MHELKEKELELAAKRVLARLGCEVQVGPKEEHDLKVTFPSKINRQVAGGVCSLAIARTFVIEVKSHVNSPAQLKDVRQLHDWVRRETRRICTPKMQDSLLWELQDARLKSFESIEKLKDYENSGESVLSDLIGSARDEHRALEWAIDRLMEATLFSSKGVLLINSQIDQKGRSGSLAGNHAREFAEKNRIALLDWKTLLEVEEALSKPESDALNFWCSLYETNGVFKFNPEYSWKNSADWIHSIFDEAEYILVGGPHLLRPLPNFSNISAPLPFG